MSSGGDIKEFLTPPAYVHIIYRLFLGNILGGKSRPTTFDGILPNLWVV